MKGLHTQEELGEPARNSEVPGAPATVSPILGPKWGGEEARPRGQERDPRPTGREVEPLSGPDTLSSVDTSHWLIPAGSQRAQVTSSQSPGIESRAKDGEWIKWGQAE